MQQEIQKEITDEIMNEIDIPTGWVITQAVEAKIADEPQNTDEILEAANLQIPLITKKVENIMNDVYDRFGVIIYNAYIHLDSDSDFHIVLLINKNDYNDIKLVSVKLMTNELLINTGEGDINVRYRYDIDEEYHMYHLAEDTKKSFNHVTIHLQNKINKPPHH